ncbi:MAG: terpene cyclase/mutase family protein [Planctomycetaceae bacterium]
MTALHPAKWLLVIPMTGLLISTSPLQAEGPPKENEKKRSGKRDEPIKKAVERGLVILQKAARNYPSHRKCFSCHHQTLPLLAMSEARKADVSIDGEIWRSQIQFTRKSFQQRQEMLEQGKRIGGSAATVSYALWTFSISDQKADQLSGAMVSYLLKRQRTDGSWRVPSFRPPLEESHITCTILAIWGLEQFHSIAQMPDVQKAVHHARAWLKKSKPKNTEERAMRLWLLARDQKYNSKKKSAALNTALQHVLNAQNADGGWSQKSGMKSDAYATGQSLYILRYAGYPVQSPAFQKGIRFLLRTQKSDGSWFVKTRSKPVQVFFDNGDPHGKNQFISVAATGWATAALAVSLTDRNRSEKD